MYYYILTLFCILVFLILYIQFIADLFKLSRRRNLFFKECTIGDGKLRKFFRKWFWFKEIFLGGIGYLCVSFSIFGLGKLFARAYIEGQHDIVNAFLFPVNIFLLIYFSNIYFKSGTIIPVPIFIRERFPRFFPYRYRSGIKVEVNDELERATNICLNLLFPSVERELKILSGGLNPSFYNGDILNGLKCLNTKYKIKILALNPKEIPERVDEKNPRKQVQEVLKELRKIGLMEGTHIRFLAKREKTHFMVVDNRHIRLEDKHDPWWSSGDGKRTAIFYFDDLNLAREYENRFDKLFLESEKEISRNE